ncbi:hypothetical protein TRM7557_01351 [Tritonibacter multivorans]|uniref:Uncharacterized protein n=1 Tax=Tritonibacter multivorans TaxID=928856 RepID=A0A0P1G6P9_9RHOB|nr:hypothetical protein TRM7557_01351 [Tritonibacter multivorans]SFD31407.1 hypothetical protein SAMN04488049_1117 [Tritonibacter multivorans]
MVASATLTWRPQPPAYCPEAGQTRPIDRPGIGQRRAKSRQAQVTREKPRAYCDAVADASV